MSKCCEESSIRGLYKLNDDVIWQIHTDIRAFRRIHRFDFEEVDVLCNLLVSEFVNPISEGGDIYVVLLGEVTLRKARDFELLDDWSPVFGTIVSYIFFSFDLIF